LRELQLVLGNVGVDFLVGRVDLRRLVENLGQECLRSGRITLRQRSVGIDLRQQCAARTRL
jgi:hypothetical protein